MKKINWEKHREKITLMRRKRRVLFSEVVIIFKRLGFRVEKISAHQFRFNESIDIFPATKSYYDRVGHKRGEIRGQSYEEFLRKYFGF